MIAQVTPQVVDDVNQLIDAFGGGRRGRLRVANELIAIALVDLAYLVEVAHLAGLSPSTVGRIRCQQTVPAVETVQRLYAVASHVMPSETADLLDMARFELLDRSLRARDW